MSAFRSITPSEATGLNEQLFNDLQSNQGSVPKLAQKLANSPAAPKAYLGFGAALSEGKLNGKQRADRGVGREYQPVRLLPVRAQRSGLKRRSFQTAGQWLTTCVLTRRKVN